MLAWNKVLCQTNMTTSKIRDTRLQSVIFKSFEIFWNLFFLIHIHTMLTWCIFLNQVVYNQITIHCQLDDWQFSALFVLLNDHFHTHICTHSYININKALLINTQTKKEKTHKKGRKDVERKVKQKAKKIQKIHD